MSLVRRIDRWIFTTGTAERLAALRIGLCSVLALRLSRGIYLDLAGQPQALFRPRSFMGFFDSMPSRGAIAMIQVAGIALAILAAAGFAARLTLPGALAAGLFLNGLVTSNGKIMHNDVLLLLCLIPLVAAPVSDAWSIDALRRRTRPPGPGVRYGWPVRVATLVVAGAYFFTGLEKVIHSGLAWAASGNMRWIMYLSSDGQRTPSDVALFVADRAWLAHALAFATLALELSFPLILFRARLAPWYAAAAVGLHGGIWLAMRLDYSAMAATVVVVLIDWPAVLEARRSRRGIVPRTYAASG
jgi:hypothetical protein